MDDTDPKPPTEADDEPGRTAFDWADEEADDDWIARPADRDPDDAQDAPASSDEQHRWRRLIAVALALVTFSWLVTTTLVSFAFVTTLNQNDEHVDALTGLLEEGQDQRGSLLGSAEEQADQRQAALAEERATTRANTAQIGESNASRDAAMADAEQSRSEASRADAEALSADAQARSLDHSADLAADRQRTDEMVAISEARDHVAQGALARAQAKLARGQTRLTAAHEELIEAQQRAADALAALADACRERQLLGCFSLPVDVGSGPLTDR